MAELKDGSRYSESYMESLPDFVKLAESYGHVGFKVDKPSEVEPVLQEAFDLKTNLCSLISSQIRKKMCGQWFKPERVCRR